MLSLTTAIEVLEPLCDLESIPMPHYHIEIRQLATLRLAQAYDLAEDRDQAKETYRRLIGGVTIPEIRKHAEIGLSRHFRLPEPVAYDLWVYVTEGELFKYKTLN